LRDCSSVPHTGYLVLNTYKKNEQSNKLEADLHFWQGQDSSQDERGASAYRTVELDDYLGGTPVQHREVQGHESAKFQSYFPKGMQLLEGGIESGFNKVDRDAYKVSSGSRARAKGCLIVWRFPFVF
jgi:hypothetical protein